MIFGIKAFPALILFTRCVQPCWFRICSQFHGLFSRRHVATAPVTCFLRTIQMISFKYAVPAHLILKAIVSHNDSFKVIVIEFRKNDYFNTRTCALLIIRFIRSRYSWEVRKFKGGMRTLGSATKFGYRQFLKIWLYLSPCQFHF